MKITGIRDLGQGLVKKKNEREIAKGARMKSRACPRKGVDAVTTCQRERVAGGARDAFSNLFNLGTRRVSESYLREYEIKQSDKQTPFLPPSSRERSRS